MLISANTREGEAFLLPSLCSSAENLVLLVEWQAWDDAPFDCVGIRDRQTKEEKPKKSR